MILSRFHLETSLTMVTSIVPARKWAAAAEQPQETKMLTWIILAFFLLSLWTTGWLCGWFCRQWWQLRGPTRLCPRGVGAMVKRSWDGWVSWWNTPMMTPHEEWVRAVREAGETPSDMVEPEERRTHGDGSTEVDRARTPTGARSIQRDWWDFPSPSGRRSRWLASSSSSSEEQRREGSSMLEVMAAAASPVLRSRNPPSRTEASRVEEAR